MAIEKVKSLRKQLHMYPELSGLETETAGRIKKFIEEHHNPRIIENIGGNGLAVIHEFSNSGPNIVIRCELDALPIEEVNDFEYRSVNKGISHKCGHDGHMAIVAGLKSHTGHKIASEQMTGFGGVLAFSVAGDFENVKVFLNNLELAHLAASLGSVSTLIGPPKVTSHVEATEEERKRLGIPETLIRCAVGIENIEDIIADFDQALSKIQNG